MTWGLAITLFAAGLILALGAGIEIAIALGVVGLAGAYAYGGTTGLNALGWLTWNAGTDFVLTAIPLFLFMGEVIMRSGLSEQFYKAVSVVLNRLPGGLTLSNIGACTIFAAVSGSSVATAATIGTVAVPEMEKRGYEPRMTLGSLAAGGTLGILIPPSIPMIVYGAMTEQSVGQLFMAGVIPGIILSLLFMTYIVARALAQPHLMPRDIIMPSWRLSLLTVLRGWPVAVLVGLVLGGIYLGIMTPTEVAAAGAAGATIIVLLHRKLTLHVLNESLESSVRTTCMVMFIYIGAQVLQYGFVSANIPRQLVQWVMSLSLSPLLILCFIYLVYIVLGCIMDGMSMMLITLPLFYPLVVQLGHQPIWFGIIMVVLIELGLITPPVGLNLFVLKGISGRPIQDVIIGSVPYCFIMLAAIALVTAVPSLALWLPAHMPK